MSDLVREHRPEHRRPQHCRHPSLATLRRPAPPARRHLGRAGRQLRPVLGQRDKGRALPVRCRRRTRDRAHRAAGIHRRSLARLPSRCAAGNDLRLSRSWSLRAGGRASLQSQQAPARPLRQADDRSAAMESRALRLSGRNARRPDLRRARQRPVQLQGLRHRSGLHLGARPAPPHGVGRYRHLRGSCEGLHEAASCGARGPARHLCRRGERGNHRLSGVAGRDGRRAAAGPHLRRRQLPARQGPQELLGLQHHRLLRAGAALRRQRRFRLLPNSRRWWRTCTKPGSR